jgi:hypothetical protein
MDPSMLRLISLCLPLWLQAECRVEIPLVQYPPLAVQARIAGTVEAKGDGRIEGPPLLVSAVKTALERVVWPDACTAGERQVTVHFRIAKGSCPVEPQERIGPAEFRVSVPEPCLYAFSTQQRRRFWFWKRAVDVLSEDLSPV